MGALVAILLLSSAPVALGAGKQASLCHAGETEFFQCQQNGGDRQAALCGHINPGKSQRTQMQWLQYRYGRPGQLELAYPARREGSLSQFTFSTPWSNSVVTMEEVAFTRAGVIYAVDAAAGDDNTFEYRVDVTMPGGRDVSLKCTSRSPTYFERVGQLVDSQH